MQNPDSHPATALERHFSRFRENVIGQRQAFASPFGQREIVYADWTASGRAYRPIEDFLQKEVMPFLGNTHSGSTVTGHAMTMAYEAAKRIIKQHVNAGAGDALIFCGSGMTAAVGKLQRILGLRLPERSADYLLHGGFKVDPLLRPIVFVTEMEHHSNHLSWLETIADVEVVPCGSGGNVDMAQFAVLLEKFSTRRNKIAAVTACSNVTGIQTPYRDIAKLLHANGGLCFVDFACSAPYADIDMCPAAGERLDAIYFSMHKFLGGPGAPGVLLFSENIYRNRVPDQPGGGTVLYSSPWGDRDYIAGIEQREDGGTPPVLQAIRAAMCVRLKEEMGTANMLAREKEMLPAIFDRLSAIKGLRVLEDGARDRLGVISFTVEGAHHGLIVKLLNDRFGVQARGGCSCAGTYGHRLMGVGPEWSAAVRGAILSGDLASKPGWVRVSIHPIITDAEIAHIMDAIAQVAAFYGEWAKDYTFDPASGEWSYRGAPPGEGVHVEGWFSPGNWVS